MLGKFLGSNTRVKVLKSFFLFPEKKHTAMELAKTLKIKAEVVKRELENLRSFGIIALKTEETESKANASYYQVDENFPLHDEIRSLIIKSEVLYEKDLTEKIKKTCRPKFLVLTGMFVNNLESPVDLLIAGNFDSKIREKLVKIIKDFEKEMGREINFTVMTVKEFKFRHFITDVFLYGILEGKRIIVVNELNLD